MANPIAALIELAKKGDRRVLLGGAALIGGGVGLYVYLHRDTGAGGGGALGNNPLASITSPVDLTGGGDSSGGGGGGGGGDLSGIAGLGGGASGDTSGLGGLSGLGALGSSPSAFGPASATDSSGLGFNPAMASTSPFDSGATTLSSLPALTPFAAPNLPSLPALSSSLPESFTGGQFGGGLPALPSLDLSGGLGGPTTSSLAETVAPTARSQATPQPTSFAGNPNDTVRGQTAPTFSSPSSQPAPYNDVAGLARAQAYVQQQQQLAAARQAITTAPTYGPNAIQQFYANLTAEQQRAQNLAAANALAAQFTAQQQQQAAIRQQNAYYASLSRAPQASAPAPVFGPNAAQAYYGAQLAQRSAAVPSAGSSFSGPGPNANQAYYANQTAQRNVQQSVYLQRQRGV